VVCKKHNREKGTLSLAQYRDRLALRRFFEGANKRRLDDLLHERLGAGGYGKQLTFETTNEAVRLFLPSGPVDEPLHECPATGERYFFVSVPAEFIQNDVELQPRPLEPDRLWELYRHLQSHTQLAPAICRLVDGHLLLFDGQHKAAAQIWAGRRILDCKVYVEPEVRRLKETNLSAHDKLRQMPFYTSTLLEKYASMAAEDWQAFLETSGPKTELAFVDFMRARVGLSRAEAIKRVRSLIYRDILENPENPVREYITEENRGRQNPLTMSRIEKTFFNEFVAAPPLNDEFESEGYHRDEEERNMVRLFKLVVDNALTGAWAPERNDDEHKKAARLFSAGALRAWVPMLRDALAPAMQVFDERERKRLFYRDLTDDQFVVVEKLLKRLFSHRVWVDLDPTLNDLRYDNAERAREMLANASLTTNWILTG